MVNWKSDGPKKECNDKRDAMTGWISVVSHYLQLLLSVIELIILCAFGMQYKIF